MIDITKIVLAVLYLCFSAITLYLIPWIKSRTSVKQQELIVGIAKTAVYAAQQHAAQQRCRRLIRRKLPQSQQKPIQQSK